MKISGMTKSYINLFELNCFLVLILIILDIIFLINFIHKDDPDSVCPI